MIFVTVGTHHQPFSRLLRAVTAIEADEVFVQYGHAPPPSGISASAAFLPFAAMEAHMRAADVVVTHAGVGSILLARRCGHTPIVVPRLRRHREHVDDHQAELTAALAERREVVAVWDVDRLAGAVAAPPARLQDRAPAGKHLHRAVRSALTGA